MKRILAIAFIGGVMMVLGYYRLSHDYGHCGVISDDNPYYCRLYGFIGMVVEFTGSLLAILVMIVNLSIEGLRLRRISEGGADCRQLVSERKPPPNIGRRLPNLQSKGGVVMRFGHCLAGFESRFHRTAIA